MAKSTIRMDRPLYNCEAYVVDKKNKFLPRGMVGELCLAGQGMARGYINRPKLTAEKELDEAALKNFTAQSLTDYMVPQNSIEKKICDAFAKVLGLKKIFRRRNLDTEITVAKISEAEKYLGASQNVSAIAAAISALKENSRAS